MNPGNEPEEEPANVGRLIKFGEVLNYIVERVIAVLMVLLVLDVWLGVAARYLFRVQIPWTEELARYLMIWTILLAISCGVARREHIGILAVLRKVPKAAQTIALLGFDLVAIVFFGVLLWFGIGLVETGMQQFSMIFGMSMAMPYASVPVAAALCLLQLFVVSFRDFGTMHGAEREGEI